MINLNIIEIECIMSSITGLATTSALNAVENKISNIRDLVKKQIMMEKLQTLQLKTSPYLIIIGSPVGYLI